MDDDDAGDDNDDDADAVDAAATDNDHGVLHKVFF